MDRNTASQERRCPFTQDPFEECFVALLRSQDVGNAICYCGGVFEECEIYQNQLHGAKDEFSNAGEEQLSR